MARRGGGIAVLLVGALATLSIAPAAAPVSPSSQAVPVRVPGDWEVSAAPAPAPPVDADLAPTPATISARDRLARALAGGQAPPTQWVQPAVARLAVVSVLLGGARPTPGTLVEVAEDLGVAAGGRLDRTAWGERVAEADRVARPLLAAAGIPLPARVGLTHLRQALHAYEVDFGTVVDARDVESLRMAVRGDLAELVRAAEVDEDPATADGLSALLHTVGVDFGDVVDPGDVDHGRARAAALLLAAAEQAAAEARAAEKAAAATTSPLAAVPAPPAPSPPEDSPPAWAPVHGSLVHRTFSLPGPVRVQVLRWRLDDPALQLRADYAAGPDGRGTVPEAAARTGAVAAVNGGFWVGEADPDGLLVRDGHLLSDTTANADGHRNIRSGFGLRDGRPVVGVPRWNGYVEIAGTRHGIHGVNRAPYEPGQILLSVPGGGADPVGGRPGTALRVPRVDLTVSGTHELPVLERRDGGTLRVDEDSMVVWVAPEATQVPATLSTVTVIASVAPEWEGVDTALAAGPWLLRAGEGAGVAQWRREGFDSAHTDRPHPRSAIGFTADGHGLIVTVDGRQPGRSEGMDHTSVARFLQGLGATDAVMLDGGGSSQMVVGGRLVNVPCCDQPLRRVSTVVTLRPR